jgi:Mor family transcriptional regulator
MIIDCVNKNKKEPNCIVQFLELIEQIPLNENGCKIWPLGISSTGYGVYSINNFTYSVPRLLHDTLKSSHYRDGKVIRHKCDNRCCCNIEHLEIGTQSQNLIDASERKRLRIGIDNNKSTFTEEQIVKIRSEYPEKSTCDLAKEYNTHSQTIRALISGKTWRHIPGYKPLNRDNRALGEKMGRSKLTEKEVLEIRSQYPEKNGPELSKEFGVTHRMIYCIIKRKNWIHI